MLNLAFHGTEPQPPPPLTPVDAELIIKRAEPAFTAHQKWVRAVYAVLICRVSPTKVQLDQQRHFESILTQWFFCETSEHVRRHPLYPALVQNHRHLIATASALFSAIEKNREITSDHFEVFSSTLDHFNGDFDALMAEMRDMLRSADPLTGVCTRFDMLPRLEQERDRVRRTGQPCSICMVDLDHFKMINDTHGHPVGDLVLQTAAGHMLGNLRPYDQVYRYGGEEFLLMLPNTHPDAALPVVERLRRRINDTSVRVTDGVSIRATASFGIAALQPGWAVHETIGMADKALYAAKVQGRNRIRIWNRQGEYQA